MKLLLCKKCASIFSLSKTEKFCGCGLTSGKYYADLKGAEYQGEFAVPLGIANPELIFAIQNQRNEGNGFDFSAFVIPKICSTFVNKTPEKVN